MAGMSMHKRAAVSVPVGVVFVGAANLKGVLLPGDDALAALNGCGWVCRLQAPALKACYQLPPAASSAR